MLEDQILDLISHYLAGQIDRSAFSQAFAGLYFRVRNSRDASPAARRLCDGVVLPFAELSQGHRSEQSFRALLENIVRPFAPPAEVVSFALYVGQQLRGPVSGNNSAIFQSRRYIRVFEEMAHGRSHSAYTALPAKKPAHGVGHPSEDPGSIMEVLPLHAEPA
jgi:hypothetical protein